MDDNIAERKDYLVLAQQKLDELTRGNLGLMSGGGRPGSAARHRPRKSSSVPSHLLSTLLYLALLSHKVEDMKAVLHEEDPQTYDEWRCLLDTLHSPEFHVRERTMQNARARRCFERKRRYKEEATKLGEELGEAQRAVAELQKLSTVVHRLEAERAKFVARDEELRAKVGELQREAEAKGGELQSLQSEVERKDHLLEERMHSIAHLERELAECRQDAAVAREKAEHAQSTLDDAKARLVTSEAKHSDYQAEMEPRVGTLQQELSEAKASNAELRARLEASNQALGVAQRNVEDSKRIVAASSASFDEIRSHSNDLREIVRSSVANLDDKIALTASMQNESKDDLEKLLARNDEVNESLALLPDLSSKAASLERRLDQVNEAVSALSSAAALERCSDRIHHGLAGMEQKLDEYSDRQRVSLRQELAVLLSKLDQLSNPHQQSYSLRQELACVRSKLDQLSELQQQTNRVPIDDDAAMNEAVNVAAMDESPTDRKAAVETPPTRDDESPSDRKAAVEPQQEEIPRNLTMSSSTTDVSATAVDLVGSFVPEAVELAVKS